MITNLEVWAELARKYRIEVEGNWRKSVTMRPGRRIEAQVFSSSSLEHVHAIGAFSIIRNGASIGAARIGRFSAIGAQLVCAPPEHPIDGVGMSSVFLKSYGWTEGGPGFYAVPPSGRRLMSKMVTIGSDVWIGRDVYIRGGVTIGHGAVVAARSVVTRDVAPYEVVGGTPARKIRDRFPAQIVADLLATRWWDLDPAWMQQVNQNNIEECAEFLTSERHRLAPLTPRAVVFTKDGYREVDGLPAPKAALP
ncbi:MAG: CatB-related O-acetyltransferase [Paracoccus sp. (in: a-proteobacteria)]